MVGVFTSTITMSYRRVHDQYSFAPSVDSVESPVIYSKYPLPTIPQLLQVVKW